MLSTIGSLLTGGVGAFLLFLIGFLPSVTIAEILPAVPDGIGEILTFINLIVPITECVNIVMWWAFFIIAVNVWYVVKDAIAGVTKAGN